MSEKIVICEKLQHIAVITMNRPQNLNALNEALADEIVSALHEAEIDDDVRVVVLTGAGRAFCAGGDLRSLDALTTFDARRRFVAKVGGIAKKIHDMPKPVIAMINGVAAGAGFNLALACDMAYAVESARFIQSFVGVGLSPDCGGFYFLAKIVGIAKTKELMFTARPIDAAEALRLNIVNGVFPADRLKAEVLAVAEEIGGKAPLAIAMTKQGINNYHASLADTLTFESLASASLLGTEDFKEGVAAFAEKRKPNFTGK